jgi:predicted deacylase
MIDTLRAGTGRPELWLIGGVHGDEVEGMRVVEEALRTLRPERGTIVGVPVAHPAALAAGTREGPDGADLNRTYPGRADGGPTERIAHELWTMLGAARPDAVVTFHSWSRSGAATPYVEHALGDEPGRSLAMALGLPFVEAWEWPQGLLGRELRALAIPSAELELYGLGRHTDEGLEYGVRAARAAAGWLGLTPKEVVPASREVRRHWLTAPVRGRAVQLVPLGAAVEAGQPVAELRGADPATLTAPAAGWVGIHVTYGEVATGAPVTVTFSPLA